MEKVKLGNIACKLQSGDGIKASKIHEKGIYPVFGGNGFRGYTDTYNQDGEYFIIGRQGAKCGNVHYNTGKAFLTEHAIVGIPKNGYNAIYVAYKLSLLDLNKLQGQSAQPGLAVSTLSEVEVEVPYFELQNKIAIFLQNIDQKIALNTRMNAELEAMAKQLYDYWFVQFDFPDENGKPYKSSGGKMVYNEILKREIPEGWEVKNINHMVNFPKRSINPYEFPKRFFRHYSIPSYDECGSFKWEKGEQIQSNKFIVQEGQILVSKLNPWYNRVVFVENSFCSICSTEFVILDTIKEDTKGYVYYTIKTNNFVSYCTKASTGTSHSQRRVSPDILLDFKIAYEEKYISLYSSLVMPMIKRINKNIAEIRNLTHLRDSLLPMLMNGQITIE